MTDQSQDKSKHMPNDDSKNEQEAAPEGIEFPNRTELENKLTAMEMKVDEYRDQCLRTQAELENIRRRSERDVANAHKYASEKLLSDLLPVMDSLVRALEGKMSPDPAAKAMHEGLQLTLDILLKTLTRHGVETITPKKGEAFDPQCHEAMSMLDHPDCDSNTIIEVLQKGYSLNGRVIRAAMVVVAR